MEIEKRKMGGDYVLFTVTGEITLKTGKRFIDPIVREIATGKARKIGIDLSRVHYIDSFGIGCLLKCNSAMEERRGVVGEIILIITEHLRKKLSVVGLDRLLKFQVVPEPAPVGQATEEESPEKEESGESKGADAAGSP